MYEGAAILRRLDQVRRGDHGNAGYVAQLLANQARIIGMGVDAGADRGRAHVDLAHQKHGFLQPQFVFAEHHRIGREFLAERHRDGVLQLGPSHLDDVLELLGLRLERPAQLRHGLDQAHDARIGRELERRRIDVVGALAHVDVFVGVQKLVVALRPTKQLKRAVGDNLIGIHVGRGARAALDDVDHELIEQPACPDLFRGGDDGVGQLGIEQAQFAVAARRRQFDRRQR